MKRGRPTKYNPAKIQVEKEFLIKDIDIYIYPSEKILNNLLLKHINLFMEKVFNEKVKSATDKKYQAIGHIELSSGQVLPIRGARLDMWVECESGRKYIIEIKNERDANYEMFKAVGQILGYSMKFPDATNFVIVSTSYDMGLLEMLKRFNIPVDFVLVNDKSFYLLKK